MGNGREVKKDLVKQETQAFLGDAVFPGQHKPKVYSLDDEFRKTKKNRHLKVYFIFSVFIIAIAGVTFFVSYSIQKRNKMLVFNIGDFQDINLSELLGAAKKLEKELQGLREELVRQEFQLQDEIYKIKDQVSREIEIMMTQIRSEEEKKAFIAEKRNQENMEIRRLQSEFQEKARLKKEQMEAIQQQIDAYDQRTMDQAKKSEEILLNYQKIHDLQMQEQKSFYERRLEQVTVRSKEELRRLKNFHEKYVDALILRYNPVFESQALLKILEKKSAAEETPALNESLPVLWESEGILTVEEFSELKTLWEDYVLLMKRLQEIPFINSVKPALLKMDEMSRFLMLTYESALQRFTRSLEDKKQLNRSYESGLQYFISRLEREDGMVAEILEGGGVLAVLNSRYDRVNSAEGLVFRGNKEWIGKVRLQRKKDRVIASVLELRPGKRIQPFDRILLILNEES